MGNGLMDKLGSIWGPINGLKLIPMTHYLAMPFIIIDMHIIGEISL